MSTVKLQIGPADHGRPMTLEEFRESEEQPGYLYELARGVLEVSEVPSDAHGQIVDNLHEAISGYRPPSVFVDFLDKALEKHQKIGRKVAQAGSAG